MTSSRLLRAFLLLCAVTCVASAASPEEAKLIAVLRSDQPPAAKDGACQRLKHIGTAACVPALAPLLVNETLSHSARYAIESIPGPEVDAALRDALGKAKGAAKSGIVDSLGDRRDPLAVPLLVPLLTDAAEGESAARALGKIGGRKAASALDATLPKATGSIRSAIFDALLRCADGLRSEDTEAARAIYGKMHAGTTPTHIRMAALRGSALAADDPAADVVRLLKAKDQAAVLAGLQLAPTISGEAATKTFAGVLPDLGPAVQVPLLRALGQRGDRVAAGGIAALATSEAEPVRVAALEALAAVGDASTVPLLAERGATAKGAEQDAARLALARLGGDGVREAILAQLAKASPEAQRELADALGRRRETGAVPALLKMAGGPDPASRLAAARSLAVLADDRALSELLLLLVHAKTDAERAALEKALASLCRGGALNQAMVTGVVLRMEDASAPARAALLRLLAREGGDVANRVLRKSMKDEDAAIREAAARAMAEFGDIGLAPDLLALAREAPTPVLAVLALRGYWRLAAGVGGETRLAMCREGLAECRRPEEKKLGLTCLGGVSHPDALVLAEKLAEDAAVGAEAESACIQIATSLISSHPTMARASLLRLKSGAGSASVKAQAAKALGEMDRYVGYITAWEVAGPYRQKGRECQQLFDIAFDPEKPNAEVAWKPAPRPTDPSLAWKVDLSSVVGGDHCVVYVRSSIYAPAKQTVRLDMGADDGIKVWVNGSLVHANNAIRGLTPEQDRATAVLNEGWNAFLVKITQHTLGCEACIRVRKEDGSVMEGLRCALGESGAGK